MDVEHPPGDPGAPPHRHNSYDEAFYVLDGVMTFRVGDDWRDMESGTFLWVPRGTVHGFHNRTGAPARVLVVATPQVVPLVREARAMMAAGPPDPDAGRAIFARHDSELVLDQH